MATVTPAAHSHGPRSRSRRWLSRRSRRWLKRVGLSAAVVLIVAAVSSWIVPSCAAKRGPSPDLVPQSDQPQ